MIRSGIIERKHQELLEGDPIIDLGFQFGVGIDLEPLLDQEALLSIQNSKLRCISPVGYLDMLILEQNARAILTDSGGMQKEAYFFGVPCVTIRRETEWVEIVEADWNVVVGADPEKIVEAVRCFKTVNPRSKFYGDGYAAEKIVDILQLTYEAEN